MLGTRCNKLAISGVEVRPMLYEGDYCHRIDCLIKSLREKCVQLSDAKRLLMCKFLCTG
jgi:hypothetical protein